MWDARPSLVSVFADLLFCADIASLILSFARMGTIAWRCHSFLGMGDSFDCMLGAVGDELAFWSCTMVDCTAQDGRRLTTEKALSRDHCRAQTSRIFSSRICATQHAEKLNAGVVQLPLDAQFLALIDAEAILLVLSADERNADDVALVQWSASGAGVQQLVASGDASSTFFYIERRAYHAQAHGVTAYSRGQGDDLGWTRSSLFTCPEPRGKHWRQRIASLAATPDGETIFVDERLGGNVWRLSCGADEEVKSRSIVTYASKGDQQWIPDGGLCCLDGRLIVAFREEVSRHERWRVDVYAFDGAFLLHVCDGASDHTRDFRAMLAYANGLFVACKDGVSLYY